MSYAEQEASQQDGLPIILYEFVDGFSTVRMTSAPEDFAFDAAPSVVYTAASISHSNVKSSSNTAKEAQTLTFNASNAYAQGLTARYAPQTALTIKRLHLTDVAQEPSVVWKGFFAQATRTKTSITATFSSYSTRAERYGQSVRTQMTCNWAVYSSIGCKLNLADFQTTMEVTAINGATLTVPDTVIAPETNYYLAGIVEYGGAFRHVQGFNQPFGGVRLSEPIPALTEAFGTSGSETISIAPGCPGWRGTCDSRFSNHLRFMATPDAPTRNRFAGERVNI